MNGLDLQAALARTRNPLPILFLTGHGDIPSSVRAMRDGAVGLSGKACTEGTPARRGEARLARDARDRAERARLRELRARFDTLTARELRSAVSCRARAG